MKTIIVSGLCGAGTTVLSRRLSEGLGIPYFSAGSIIREEAQKLGIPVEKMGNELSLEFNQKVDQRVREIAEKGDVVLDCRYGALICPDIDTLNILLEAPLRTRVERIQHRDGGGYEVGCLVCKRDWEERGYSKRVYGRDFADRSLYNLVFNSNRVTLEEEFDSISSAL